MHANTRKLVVAAMMTALACVATMIIKIPSPVKGYINLGDCSVLLCGWLLSPVWGFWAAGLGSALADVLSGYVIYGPATFLIKGLMALVAHYGYALLKAKCGSLTSKILSGIAAEMVMLVGYFLFAGMLYGFGPAVLNIPANAVQGIAGIMIGIILSQFFEKSKTTIPQEEKR